MSNLKKLFILLFICISQVGSSLTWDFPNKNITSPSISAQGDDPRVAMDNKGHAIAVFERDYDLSPGPGTDYKTQVSLSSDFGKTWSIPFFIDPAYQLRERNPRIVMDEVGHAVCSFVRTDGPTREVFVSRSTDFGATWTNPIQLSPGTFATSTDCELAMGSDGNVIVVWDYAFPTPGIQEAHSSNFGASWNLPGAAIISDPTVSATSTPFIAISDRGRAVVVWEATFGGDIKVQEAHTSNGGDTWVIPDSTTYISTTIAGITEVAIDSTGRYSVITWRLENPGGTYTVQEAHSSNFANSYSSPSNLSAPDVGGAIPTPHIAMNSLGTVIVTWERLDTVSGHSVVQEAHSSNFGESFTLPGLTSFISPSTIDCQIPIAQVDEKNNAVITWIAAELFTGRERVQAATSSNGGASYILPTDTEYLSEDLIDESAKPKVALNSGNAIIIWVQAPLDYIQAQNSLRLTPTEGPPFRFWLQAPPIVEQR